MTLHFLLMEPLYTCFAQEFKDCNFTSLNLKPTYSIIKGKHVVNLTIDAFDKYHNCLKRQVFKFINDKYHPTPKNPLQNITPEQLDQAFKIGKMEILGRIYNNDYAKYNNYTNKLNELQAYAHADYNPEITQDPIQIDENPEDFLY